MGDCILRGNSRNILNFKVVGGKSVPESPKENMIWVDTDTAITDWAFSAEQPTAVPGRVWFHTDTTSAGEFNALKKNGIQVYPTFAKQYVKDAWEYVTAMTYQNGKWEEWVEDIYLYNEGDTCDSASGGWTYENMKYGTTLIGTRLTFQEKSMHIVGSSGSSMGGCRTANMIDLSKFTKLHAEVLASNQTAATFMSVCSQMPDIKANSIASVQLPITEQVISLDISNIKEGYVVFCSDVYSATIKKVWLSA